MPRQRSVRYAWLTIKDGIIDDIFEQKLGPGERIPTVAELAKRYGVSTTTVRQAIDELASEGILEVRQGRGTAVAPLKIDYDPTESFTDQALELGKTAHTRIYRTEWSEPHAETMMALGLTPKSKIWRVTRLHYLDEEPVSVEVIEFPKKLAERFIGDSWILESYYDKLKELLGIKEWEVDITTARVTTERAFSDLLSIPRRTPFFHLQRIISLEGSPLFISFLVLRCDKFQLRFATPHSQAKK